MTSNTKGSVMKLRWIACGFALGVAASLMTCEVRSQQEVEPDHDMDQMMKLWEKYALPGPHHKKLEVYAGTWDATTKMWMEGPHAPPAVSTSTVWATPIFGGRFIETRAQGGVWLQSSSTGIYYAEGTIDETGKVFTYFATYDEWESDRRAVPYKIEDRIVDENTIVSSMYDLTMKPDESKVFEMVLTRAAVKPPGGE
jgi:hypothetical protein